MQAARALAEGESKHHQDRLNIALADAVRTSTLLHTIVQNEKREKPVCVIRVALTLLRPVACDLQERAKQEFIKAQSKITQSEVRHPTKTI